MDLIENQAVCSSASRRGRYRQDNVEIGSQTTRSIPYVIIPMKLGQLHIEVKAAVKNKLFTDGIRKNLLVVVRETESYSQLGAWYAILKLSPVVVQILKL